MKDLRLLSWWERERKKNKGEKRLGAHETENRNERAVCCPGLREEEEKKREKTGWTTKKKKKQKKKKKE